MDRGFREIRHISLPNCHSDIRHQNLISDMLPLLRQVHISWKGYDFKI